MTRLLLFALFGLCTADVPDTSGVGSPWTSLDGDGPKLKAGINCYKLPGATTFHVVFKVYESDQAEDGMGNKYFDFKQCRALYRDMVDDTNMKVEDQTCDDGMGGEITTTTDPDIWTFEFDVTEGAATTPCGGVQDGTDAALYLFAFRCLRDEKYDSQYNVVFLPQCKADEPSNTLISVLGADGSVMVLVQDGAQTLVDRQYRVSFDLVDGYNTPDHAVDTIITGAVDLGDPIILRICLWIDDDRIMFDDDGFGILGMRPHSCIATRDPSQAVDAADPDVDADPATVEIIGANGCGTGDPLAAQLANTHFNYWISPTTDGNEPWKHSPNCFYTTAYGAVAFLGKTIQTGAPDRKITIDCALDYCHASSETECFGSLAGDGSDDADYGDCRRRKRQTGSGSGSLNSTDLPKSVSTTLTIRMPVDGETQKKTTPDGCFDTPTFYALTAVLAVLLLVVLAIAGFLALKLRNVMSDIDSQDSKVGIENKAYY